MPPRRLTQDDVRRIALALPAVESGAHMGHADLRVHNKIFASLPTDPKTVSMKIAPANLDALVREDPASFRDVWGGRWVGVSLASVTKARLQALLEDAWRLTAPKGLHAALGEAKRDSPVAAAGAKVREPTRQGGTPRRVRHPMPESVRRALAEAGLVEAYRRRPPYQRNDYLGWIARAVRPQTRARRLSQMLEELSGGTRYMKMPYQDRPGGEDR